MRTPGTSILKMMLRTTRNLHLFPQLTAFLLNRSTTGRLATVCGFVLAWSGGFSLRLCIRSVFGLRISRIFKIFWGVYVSSPDPTLLARRTSTNHYSRAELLLGGQLFVLWDLCGVLLLAGQSSDYQTCVNHWRSCCRGISIKCRKNQSVEGRGGGLEGCTYCKVSSGVWWMRFCQRPWRKQGLVIVSGSCWGDCQVDPANK